MARSFAEKYNIPQSVIDASMDKFKDCNPFEKGASQNALAIFALVYTGETEYVQTVISKNRAIPERSIRQIACFAAHLGHLDIVRLCLKRVNIKNILWTQVLIEAVMARQYDIVKMLLEHKISVNSVLRAKCKSKSHKFGENALMWAAASGDVQMVELLLNAGANINDANMYEESGGTKTYIGMTSLMYAAKYSSNPAVVLTLIKRGADVNAREFTKNNSALDYAIQSHNPDVAQILVDNGAYVSDQNKIDLRQLVNNPQQNTDTQTAAPYNTPQIRIVGCEISNYKSVEYGKIEFAGLLDSDNHLHSDILALYGQNGSGKTTFIEAIEILQHLVTNNCFVSYFLGKDDKGVAHVISPYCDNIRNVADPVHLVFVFEKIDTNSNTPVYIKYSFKLSYSCTAPNDRADFYCFDEKIDISDTPDFTNACNLASGDDTPSPKSQIFQADLINDIQTANPVVWDLYNYIKNNLIVIKTKNMGQIHNRELLYLYAPDSTLSVGFGPANLTVRNVRRLNQIVGNLNKILPMVGAGLQLKMRYNKDTHYAYLSQLEKLMKTLAQVTSVFSYSDVDATERFDNCFWRYYWGRTIKNAVRDIRADLLAFISSPDFDMSVSQHGGQMENIIQKHLAALQDTLETEFGLNGRVCITKMKTDLYNKLLYTLPQDFARIYVELSAGRGDIETKLYSESDGILTIVSYLSALLLVFNDATKTLVIDELDVGIHEYLLIKILQAFTLVAQGQLIFTAHNLQTMDAFNPENEKFAVFTTTNPKNRYARLPADNRHVYSLRERYFQEIFNQTQTNPLFSYMGDLDFQDAFLMIDQGGQ